RPTPAAPCTLSLHDALPICLGKPRADEVQVRVLAAGVNFVDTYYRSGLYPSELPFIPGSEMCGEVVALGVRVTDFAVGDRVATRSEEHTSELQSRENLVCRL